MTLEKNRFAGGTLDRAPERRVEAAWLEARLGDPTTRVVPVWRSRSLLSHDERRAAVGLAPDHPGLSVPDPEPIFLGVEGASAVFALDLSPLGDDEHPPLSEEGEWLDIHRVGQLLPRTDAALLAYARAIVSWHRRHRFCGRCGTPTEVAQGGHVRRCGSADCGSEHFPRTDPAIIVRVTDEDRCLLARKRIWPAGTYSVLAGFVEPGESLTEAVAREVREETSIDVVDVRYHSSQPWPFPTSIMLGFTAVRAGGELRVDGNELEEARWFERHEVRAGLEQGRLRLPGQVSISRRLIQEWLDAAD